MIAPLSSILNHKLLHDDRKSTLVKLMVEYGWIHDTLVKLMVEYGWINATLLKLMVDYGWVNAELYMGDLYPINIPLKVAYLSSNLNHKLLHSDP